MCLPVRRTIGDSGGWEIQHDELGRSRSRRGSERNKFEKEKKVNKRKSARTSELIFLIRGGNGTVGGERRHVKLPLSKGLVHTMFSDGGQAREQNPFKSIIIERKHSLNASDPHQKSGGRKRTEYRNRRRENFDANFRG